MNSSAAAWLSRPLAVLGAVTAVRTCYGVLDFLYLYNRPSSLSLYKHGRDYSTWALVTGASDGIGLGFVESLLSQGFNVLLHGRNEAKLSAVVARLAPAYPRAQLRIVVADAADPQPDIAAIEAAVESLPGKLTILVNNVGGAIEGVSYMGRLIDQSADQTEYTINLNARFMVLLTQALGKRMVRDGPALVINISSLGASVVAPYLAAYTGAKCAALRLSESLRLEMTGTGLDVLCTLVGQTHTNSNKIAVGPVVPDGRTVADAALARVGCGKPVVVAWWRHALLKAFLDSLPIWALDRLMLQMMGEAKDLAETELEKKLKSR